MRLSEELRASLDAAALRYQDALLEPDLPAQNYLLGRGISLAVADAYRLGVVDGSIPEHASYKGWISIPYITRLGGVVSLKFRRLSGGEPKYLTPYPTRLYNTMALDRAERLGYVAICEGEFDAIILDALCAIPAVAIPGVETWKAHPEWREMFTGFSRVLLFMDQDQDRPGPDGKVRNPGRELGNQLLSALDTAHLVQLPAKDVNEAYLQFGADKIREMAGV
jgi:DNA primase